MVWKKKRKFKKERERKKKFVFPREVKQMVLGVILILLAVLTILSFFDKAGAAGQYFITGTRFLIGSTVFLIPLILILGGLSFLIYRGERKFLTGPVILAVLILILGITGIIKGGKLGYFISWPFLKFFGFWATQIIFSALIFIGGLIFWYFLKPAKKKEKESPQYQQPPASLPALVQEPEEKSSFIRKLFAPKFKVKEIPGPAQGQGAFQGAKLAAGGSELSSLETGLAVSKAKTFSFQPPSLNLLESDREVPTSGDTKINSAIIGKTLQNFGIEVAMSEINIGPTVTQYTFKPAEGIKLSKITGLSNDLALALASHPIRIEAPVPGRSLVGIEVPNKGRAQVRLRNLIEAQDFQKSSADLFLALGRDVSGFPVFADLAKMPHLLVAGATGTGKTIFLNSLILSLLYQPNTQTKTAGPENLRFILVDPKRVEFPVYNKLPHLFCPVIYSASRTIAVLKWLTGEMERRFDVLSEAKARDIDSFNQKILGTETPALPFIVLIIDELADLMAAKGREIEAGIVRLAQMARAVGIHLVVATQRPSVEVITGLIKANITSRITFQVASQVDSRTVLDVSGAEKLLGSGDMLYVSAQVPKPKRIQAAYVSEKEVKRVVKDIESRTESETKQPDIEQDLERVLSESGGSSSEVKRDFYNNNDEPLYNDAKKIVIESGKASASLLQRRLRIGYARAARLIDILEEKRVVGPADGAKPREILGLDENQTWEKV